MDEKIALPDALVQPDYGGGSTMNLSVSILQHFGAAAEGMVGLRPQILPPALLDGASVVLLLIVDGLGYRQLAREIAAGNAPNLARLLEQYPAQFQPITTTLPSMTACALTTIHTAAPPAQHGLLGWNLYLEQAGQMVDMLKFAPAATPGQGEIKSINPEGFIAVPTIYQRLKAGGVKASMVNYSMFRETALTRIMHAGSDYHGFITSTDLFIQMRQLAEQADGPTFICGYWDKVDTISHIYGSGGEPISGEIAQLDFILNRELLSKLTHKDVTLLITADHGQITTEFERILLANEDHELLAQLAQLPGGDSRTVYLYARAGQQDALFSYVQQRYGHLATTLTRDQFIAAGLLGGPLDPRFRSRIGDVVLLMHENWRIRTLYNEEQAKFTPLLGMHGGMTGDEMYSTMIAVRLS